MGLIRGIVDIGLGGLLRGVCGVLVNWDRLGTYLYY